MAESFTYPKHIRLTRKNDISMVFEQGQYENLGPVNVKYLKSVSAESRFLVAVKKKVGNAVERNRIKRLLREAIRLHRHELIPSLDLCFFVSKRPKYPMHLEYLETKVQGLFDRLNQLNQMNQNTGCSGKRITPRSPVGNSTLGRQESHNNVVSWCPPEWIPTLV